MRPWMPGCGTWAACMLLRCGGAVAAVLQDQLRVGSGRGQKTSAELFSWHQVKAAWADLKRLRRELKVDPVRMTKTPSFPGAGRKRVLGCEKGSTPDKNSGGRWAIGFSELWSVCQVPAVTAAGTTYVLNLVFRLSISLGILTHQGTAAGRISWDHFTTARTADFVALRNPPEGIKRTNNDQRKPHKHQQIEHDLDHEKARCDGFRITRFATGFTNEWVFHFKLLIPACRSR